MSETEPEVVPETTAAEDLNFQRRLAAGTGGDDWHLSEEDKAVDAQVKAAEAGDESADLARRLAAGTGGGDWHLTDADKAADAVAKADLTITPYVEANAPVEAQSPSQPGPTPGADRPEATPEGEVAASAPEA